MESSPKSFNLGDTAPSKQHPSVFQLLDLPLELRLAIYENLVIQNSERFLDLSIGHKDATHRVRLRTNPQLTCLSLVCKQMCTEISQAYPADSLTLRMRPTLSWCQIPAGADPMVCVNSEPLQEYFTQILQTVAGSEHSARSYLDFLRPEKSENTMAKFPTPDEAIDDPHPQFGVIFAALSAFTPVRAMFQRVKKLEISEDLLAWRYPYLALSWLTNIFVNLQCLSVLEHPQEIRMHETGIDWGDLDVDFHKFVPAAECYHYSDFVRSLAQRGINMLWSARCDFSLKCFDDPYYTEDWDDSDRASIGEFVPFHEATFAYTYNFQTNEIIAFEIYRTLDRCGSGCKYESRFAAALCATIAKEKVKVNQSLVDNLMLDLLGQRDCISRCDDPGWDRPIVCPVMKSWYNLEEYERDEEHSKLLI